MNIFGVKGKVLAVERAAGVVLGGGNVGLTVFCQIQLLSPKQTYHRAQLMLSAELVAPLGTHF